MRVMMMVPAAVSDTKQDMLVFTCDCGTVEQTTLEAGKV
jgi:hypothetical protein